MLPFSKFLNRFSLFPRKTSKAQLPSVSQITRSYLEEKEAHSLNLTQKCGIGDDSKP